MVRARRCNGMTAVPGSERGTILVVDDEPNIADLVELYLTREGYRVVKNHTGEMALETVQRDRPRLVVLDVGLPDIDGLEVCKRLRRDSQIPVIFLTARDSEIDRVLGLELGADDYITKPFSTAELVARVKAVLRRSDGNAAATPSEVLQIGDVAIDLARREVRVRDQVVQFTAKEFELVKFLAQRPGRALSRQQLLDGVWGYDWFGDARTVDVHIAQVRKKLAGTLDISTVRGLGYRLEPRR
jgi:DNA-binding response OmpR family regulator